MFFPNSQIQNGLRHVYITTEYCKEFINSPVHVNTFMLLFFIYTKRKMKIQIDQFPAEERIIYVGSFIPSAL